MPFATMQTLSVRSTPTRVAIQFGWPPGHKEAAMRKLTILALFWCTAITAAPAVNVTVKWGAASSCVAGAPQCRYVVSRAALSGSNCPATNQKFYTPLNAQSLTVSLSYVNSVPKNSSWCYIVQTEQTFNGILGVSVPGALQKFVKVH